jgi:F-type H+-transporting ATPase subunit b
MLAVAHTPLASGGSFLITPNVGIMIWTIVVFAISLFILRRAVFPQIGKALDTRAKAIEGDIDAAAQLRAEADKVLDEYRERLKEARGQADEIVQRARQAASTHEQESKAKGQELLAEASARAQQEIEAATRRALDDLRKEVATLTILATEKVTRKTLTEADQRALVEDALRELDFSAISSES